jgi:glycosyltransferase involved in cell wall biosynthesis
MTIAPAISVIMAAYNGAALLGETLSSLGAQTCGDFELIVVDDCSTDDTLALLRAWPDPRIRVIASDQNQGPVRARNRAFAEARGRYVAALDQDDLCRPGRFARQRAFLDANPDVVLVASAAGLLERGERRPGRIAPSTTPALVDWLLRLSNPIVWSSTMFRRDVAAQLDPFTRPDILYAEDFDLYHRLRAFGRIARIDEELVDYRLHAGSASRRFTERMIASAALVLADANRDALGYDADEAAGLLARHVMAGMAVPNRATLERLAHIIARLQQHFLRGRALGPADIRLIHRETSRLWWRMARTAVRSGQLGLHGAVTVRPSSARISESEPADLMLSRLIGLGRTKRP